ncbi:hypothetical protein L228DRAFT_248058 [Xylona heveae TC161]|uniref:LEM-like domain-containing protein n=1 Tax=Xylona heveae (strain CBS 132557 / TC161) TaxID=1328760 RepID=A0A165GMN8_XYLHT|nr:hypothetical protein L228DRAFT_248058 [Xylona heveae TC161]KZF22379.1 hypothetical protein L228DRAFT_248058 [Xylona heveae TC161]
MASINDDELEYLSPNFDPASLTVPRLRAILVAHDVPYPSAAKKAQLIELFEDHVVPEAERLLAARARTKRSSRGITDMPSSQEGSLAGDDDEEEIVPTRAPPVTPRRRGRKSGKVAAEEEFDTPAATRTPAAASIVSRRKSTKHSRASDTENATDPELQRPVARRSRKSTATPVVKQESPEQGWHGHRAEADVFTDDNPFQSGSSPVYEPVSARKSRKSVGAAKSSSRRKSSVSRRRTGHLSPNRNIEQRDGFAAPSSRTFDVPVSRLRGRKQEEEEELAVDDEGVETGEEFTPEEQLELVRARAKNGEADILPPRRKKPKRKGGISKSAPWVILLALAGGYAGWWRREKLDIGYCGIGRDPSIPTNVNIPDWANFLEPQCEPCPPHAYCYSQLETQCEPDFVYKSHPLSFGGLVPLPPTCEPDGEKARRVKAVADRAVEELRERRAKWECGDLKDTKGKELPAVEIDEQELKQEVGKKRRRGLSQSEFEDLWSAALGEITSRDEVLSGLDG